MRRRPGQPRTASRPRDSASHAQRNTRRTGGALIGTGRNRRDSRQQRSHANAVELPLHSQPRERVRQSLNHCLPYDRGLSLATAELRHELRRRTRRQGRRLRRDEVSMHAFLLTTGSLEGSRAFRSFDRRTMVSHSFRRWRRLRRDQSRHQLRRRHQPARLELSFQLPSTHPRK